MYWWGLIKENNLTRSHNQNLRAGGNSSLSSSRGVVGGVAEGIPHRNSVLIRTLWEVIQQIDWDMLQFPRMSSGRIGTEASYSIEHHWRVQFDERLLCSCHTLGGPSPTRRFSLVMRRETRYPHLCHRSLRRNQTVGGSKPWKRGFSATDSPCTVSGVVRSDSPSWAGLERA